MDDDRAPNSVNGSLRPKEPKYDWRIELVALAHKALDRFSEEAIVIVIVLFLKAAPELMGHRMPTVDTLSFFALSSYLSIRLLKMLMRQGRD